MLDFYTDLLSYSPAEPGPSHDLHNHQVFEVVCCESNSEPEEEEEMDDPEHNEENLVYFWPDVESEADDGNNNVCVTQLEDLRLVQGEEARQLEVEQEINDLGT